MVSLSELECLVEAGPAVYTLAPGRHMLRRELRVPAGVVVRCAPGAAMLRGRIILEGGHVYGLTLEGSVLVRGTGSRWIGGSVLWASENGFALRRAHGAEIRDVEISGCGSFGVHMDDRCAYNLVQGCRGKNRLELVGIRFDCFRNRVIGNHARGTTDNGISITGFENVVQGNICVGNAHSGIGVYGDRNVIQGNICRNNGADPFAGIFVKGDFGGAGTDNAITGNVCLGGTGLRIRANATGTLAEGNIGTVVDERP